MGNEITPDHGAAHSTAEKKNAAQLPSRLAAAVNPASIDSEATYRHSSTEYKIRSKDTLAKIARRHEAQLRKAGVWGEGESVWAVTKKIAQFNGHKDDSFILRIGKKLKIPALEKVVAGETVHIVTKDDSKGLGSIALKYKEQLQAAGYWEKGKSMWAGAVKKLAEFNEIDINQRLEPGQKIKIPPVPQKQPHVQLDRNPGAGTTTDTAVLPRSTKLAIAELNICRDTPAAAQRIINIAYNKKRPLGGIDVLSGENTAAVMVLQGAMSQLSFGKEKAFDFKGSMPLDGHPEVNLTPVLGARNEYMAQRLELTYKKLSENPALDEGLRSELKTEFEKFNGMPGKALFKALGVDIEQQVASINHGAALEQTELHASCRKLVMQAYSEFQSAKGITTESPTNIGPITAAAYNKDWTELQQGKMKLTADSR